VLFAGVEVLRRSLLRFGSDPAINSPSLGRSRVGGALIYTISELGLACEVSSIGRDAVRELGVSPPRHSWQGTMQGEFSVPGCGLCCLPGVRLYRGSRGLCCTVRCGVEL
jgi:hypothetical protein